MPRQPKGLGTARFSDNSSPFFKDIAKYPILDKEVQNDLAVKAQNGDDEARQKLYKSNYRMLARIAIELTKDGIDPYDLIQEGFFGLMTAVDKFSVEGPNSFPHYATWWIRMRMLRFIWDNGRQIRTSEKRRLKEHKLTEISLRQLALTGSVPSVDELVAESKFSRQVVTDFCGTFSLVPSGPVKATDLEEVEDPGSAPELLMESIDRPAVAEVLDRCLDSLTPFQRALLRGKFGLDGPPMNCSDLARKYGTVPENVRCIINRALALLRKKYGKMLLPFMEE